MDTNTLIRELLLPSNPVQAMTWLFAGILLGVLLHSRPPRR